MNYLTTTTDPKPDPTDIEAYPTAVRAEAQAIQALTDWLITPEGKGAAPGDIKLWIVERGWPPGKYQRWVEIIAANLAIAQCEPGQANHPETILFRLDSRLEKIAHDAIDRSDARHAILATESQAKLHRLGGYAPASTQVNLQVNASNANAHLLTDDDLAKIARSPNASSSPAPSIEDLLS